MFIRSLLKPTVSPLHLTLCFPQVDKLTGRDHTLGIFISLPPTRKSWSKCVVEFQMTLCFSHGRKGTVEILLQRSLCCFAFHQKPVSFVKEIV